VTRSQPLSARPWLLRWLLVVLTLAGLGILQGGHCADDMSVDLTASAAPISAAVEMRDTAAVAASPGAAEHQHGDMRTQTERNSFGSTADDCHVLPATVAGTAAAAGLSMPTAVRTVVAGPRPGPFKQHLLLAMTLAHLGVSRT
jgi:hypothetical protein